jgi:hypothetical protein
MIGELTNATEKVALSMSYRAQHCLGTINSSLMLSVFMEVVDIRARQGAGEVRDGGSGMVRQRGDGWRDLCTDFER